MTKTRAVSIIFILLSQAFTQHYAYTQADGRVPTWVTPPPRESATGTYTLAWSAVAGAPHYQLVRSPVPDLSVTTDSFYPPRSTASTTSFTETNLVPGTYYYGVRAWYNTSRAGPFSAVAGPTTVTALQNPRPLQEQAREGDPIILVHGLRSSAKTWDAFAAYAAKQGWKMGVDFDLTKPKVSSALMYRDYEGLRALGAREGRGVDPQTGLWQVGRMYTLTFSDNQGLALRKQGEELSWVVDAVKQITKSNKVVLVGHSMGGLAARAYLQYYARGDVSSLVTIGTPHAGSILAYARSYLNEHPNDKSATSMKDMIDVLGIDLNSIAVQELEPGSRGLLDLNGKTLPTDVKYVCIIGDSKTEMAESIADKYFKVFKYYEKRAGAPYSPKLMRTHSDGIVPVVSQYLFSLYPEKGYKHEELFTDRTHTNETDDVETIWNALQGVTSIAKASPAIDVMPAPQGMEYIRKNTQGFHEYKNIKDDSLMILIPAGEFDMGTDKYVPGLAHKVYLGAYLIDKTEVTWGQYKRFCQATSRPPPLSPSFSVGDDHPVVKVDWNDSKRYCEWAGKRLPTEAEWEKGARGTDGREWPWGNEWDSGKANAEDKLHKTTPVGNYPGGASPWGLLDMAGNVWEWCGDWYDREYYMKGENRNPRGPASGEQRITRGGCWKSHRDDTACSSRLFDPPVAKSYFCGFRGARDILSTQTSKPSKDSGVLQDHVEKLGRALVYKDRKAAAQQDIATLAQAVDVFESDLGRYPATEEGLNALIAAPSEMKDPTKWKGPYMRKKELPLDPWGNPYKYTYPGSGGPKTFDLFSAGPDGQEGTEDDLRH